MVNNEANLPVLDLPDDPALQRREEYSLKGKVALLSSSSRAYFVLLLFSKGKFQFHIHTHTHTWIAKRGEYKISLRFLKKRKRRKLEFVSSFLLYRNIRKESGRVASSPGGRREKLKKLLPLAYSSPGEE